MNLQEYGSYDALGLAELVRRGEIEAAELADLARAAVATLNPTLNAVIETNPAPVVATKRGAAAGAFEGVPFLLKDLGCHTAGRFEAGSRLAAGNRVEHETELAARFRKAGVTFLGRTATPEFGYNVSTESVLTGPTRNPWDASRSAGGSSGGSAAAVAAGIVPVAHANDGGGSIRVPAAFCGLVGLKPTRGRNSIAPDFDEALSGLACEHVVSRTLRDSAAMLDATAGRAPGDPYDAPAPERLFAIEIESDPGRLAIALNLEPWPGDPVERETIEKVQAAARLCESLGHRVEMATFGFDYETFLIANLRIWTSFLVLLVDHVAQAVGRTPSEETLEAATLASYAYGKRVTAVELLEARLVCNAVSRLSADFFSRFDLMLSPVTIAPAPPLGVMNQNRTGIRAEEWLDQIFRYAPFPAIFNVTGQPALVLPWARSADGLPIGVHFAARFGDEALLLRFGGQFERASPGIGRPPIYVGAERP